MFFGKNAFLSGCGLFLVLKVEFTGFLQGSFRVPTEFLNGTYRVATGVLHTDVAVVSLCQLNLSQHLLRQASWRPGCIISTLGHAQPPDGCREQVLVGQVSD